MKKRKSLAIVALVAIVVAAIGACAPSPPRTPRAIGEPSPTASTSAEPLWIRNKE